jgi:hypothetical protein
MKIYGSALPIVDANRTAVDSASASAGPVESTESTTGDGGNSEDFQGDTCYENDGLPAQGSGLEAS